MNPQTAVALGSFLAAAGVGLGAFGAHALKARLDAADLAIFETGVRYHLLHALAIVLVGVLAKETRAAGWAFAAGIVLFSGSLYVLVLTGQRWLGAVTPLGGVCFIGGWIWLGVTALRATP